MSGQGEPRSIQSGQNDPQPKYGLWTWSVGSPVCLYLGVLSLSTGLSIIGAVTMNTPSQLVSSVKPCWLALSIVRHDLLFHQCASVSGVIDISHSMRHPSFVKTILGVATEPCKAMRPYGLMSPNSLKFSNEISLFLIFLKKPLFWGLYELLCLWAISYQPICSSLAFCRSLIPGT